MIRAVALVTGALAVLLCGGSAAASLAVGPSKPAGAGFVRPVDGAQITQGFGCTGFSFEPVDVACPGGHWHSGIDLAAAAGTPVFATQSGIVQVSLSASGYGLHVVIDHGGGLSSLYGHLSSVAVPSGEYVDAGQVVGAVGSSGNSTGPHLHFEIRRDGIPEDPHDDVRLP
jgi:murein DD-endopeptidase MepM/ murein hydrolase activator NlpD